MIVKVEWVPVDPMEILKGMNKTLYCLTQFVKSGEKACRLENSAYSSSESLRQSFIREINKHFKDKVALVKRGNEFFLLRRDI
jgi:hypothetical protein